MSDYSVYPNAIDGYAQLPVAVDGVTAINAFSVNTLRSAIAHVETELGVLPSGVYPTVMARLDDVDIEISDLDTTKINGPAFATSNAIVRYDGITGKLVKNSTVIIDDLGNITTGGTIVADSISTVGNLDVLGNIIVSGIVDGRDISLDGAIQDAHISDFLNPHNTDHGDLLGLAGDDHTQYLLVDGTRAMTGNLDMDLNNIENVNKLEHVSDILFDISHIPSVHNEGALHWNSEDGPALDAFGRLRASSQHTLFDSKQIFNNAPGVWDDQQVSGGGTASVYNQDEAATTISVSNLMAGRRTRQTFMRFNYQSGKSQQVLMTGILAETGSGPGNRFTIGMGDDKNGLFFEDKMGHCK